MHQRIESWSFFSQWLAIQRRQKRGKKAFGLTTSESSPRCSGSRGFSSVICCSFIPAILDSNLQSPWQQNDKNTHTYKLAFWSQHEDYILHLVSIEGKCKAVTNSNYECRAQLWKIASHGANFKMAQGKIMKRLNYEWIIWPLQFHHCKILQTSTFFE